MKRFEISIWNPDQDIKNFVPRKRRKTKIKDFLDVYCCLRLEEQAEYNCKGYVDTPDNFALYYPWLLPNGFCFLSTRRLLVTSFVIDPLKETLDHFFSQIRVGNSMDELILKCHILFPHTYWHEEMKPVLQENQPLVPFSFRITSVVEGCPFEAGSISINLSEYEPSQADDFDLYVRGELNFGNQDTEVVSFTITTPKRMARRYNTYFLHSSNTVQITYAHLLVSKFNYTEISQTIEESLTFVKGNSKTEVLLRVAARMDIQNLEQYLGTVLIDSESVYTLEEGGVNFNYR